MHDDIQVTGTAPHPLDPPVHLRAKSQRQIEIEQQAAVDRARRVQPVLDSNLAIANRDAAEEFALLCKTINKSVTVLMAGGICWALVRTGYWIVSLFN